MAKERVVTAPSTETLEALLQDFDETLREVERGLKKVLSRKAQSEAYWDELTKLHPLLTLVESQSNSLQEEIESLIDRLPED
jgi:predicted nuclease with TOPRIM domain